MTTLSSQSPKTGRKPTEFTNFFTENMDGVSLLLALETFKKRLINNRLEVQREEGYLSNEVFSFGSPASENELSKLPTQTPNEMIEFLKSHNGAEIFIHPEYGGGILFFSVDEILEYIDIWECPENCIPVGVGRDGEWIICEVDRTGGNHIWVGEFISFEDEYERLSMGFADWFDYLLVAQGAHFWDWFR